MLNNKNNMLTQQLQTCGIHQEAVLALFNQLPREDFVPKKFHALAFSDARLPLGHHKTMMTPLEEATIIQALDVQSHHTVLEIGTGSGYLTALLSLQAKHVFSIECDEATVHTAQKKLDDHAIHNVTLITGDGLHGYLDEAPYDRIVLTGSIEHLDKAFHPQLLQGGKLFAIIGKAPVMKACLLTLDSQDQWHTTFLFETNIAPLMNRFKPSSFEF